MIDAEIQNGQVTKRYIFINLRPVAVIEYENDSANDDKNNSTLGSKYAGYRPKSPAIYAIHTDHLGTPQAITDTQQAVVWRADYATFGKATVQARVVDSKIKTASSGIISSAHAATGKEKVFEFNLRFAGQYEDVESGYHYNWHRYYDPSTGRYLTPDPIGLAGGLNGYGYAGQDPMGAVDPWGLASEALDQIAALGYWDAAMTKLDADNALDATQNSGLPGLHNGQADAYRHCYWSCLMTKRMGAVKAETAGNIHEAWGDKAGQPAIERQMDLHNNSVGRDCAGSKDSSMDCDKSCRNKLTDGSLWWIDGTTNTLVHYVPKVK